MSGRPPVWVVGFPRCGSSSLCAALRLLGWDAVHNPRHWDHLDGHDAAGDVFVTANWRALRRAFPESLFVLNTRDFDGWVASLSRIPGFWESDRLFDRHHRAEVYGTHDPHDRQALRRAWDAHHAEVRRTLPRERLLVLPQPFEWKPVCRFLGVAVPDSPFPWLNRGHNLDARVGLP